MKHSKNTQQLQPSTRPFKYNDGNSWAPTVSHYWSQANRRSARPSSRLLGTPEQCLDEVITVGKSQIWNIQIKMAFDALQSPINHLMVKEINKYACIIINIYTVIICMYIYIYVCMIMCVIVCVSVLQSIKGSHPNARRVLYSSVY